MSLPQPPVQSRSCLPALLFINSSHSSWDGLFTHPSLCQTPSFSRTGTSALCLEARKPGTVWVLGECSSSWIQLHRTTLGGGSGRLQSCLLGAKGEAELQLMTVGQTWFWIQKLDFPSRLLRMLSIGARESAALSKHVNAEKNTPQPQAAGGRSRLRVTHQAHGRE